MKRRARHGKEWRAIKTLYYQLIRYDGDYVVLKDRTNGEEILVARAFLPEQAQEGSFLRYELLSYTMDE